MVHRKHSHDHLLPAWNYLHVHWVWDLGLVSGPPKCCCYRDQYSWCRRRDFSACPALTPHWNVVVMLLVSFCSVVHVCTHPPVQVPLGKNERAIDWSTGHCVVIKNCPEFRMQVRASAFWLFTGSHARVVVSDERPQCIFRIFSRPNKHTYFLIIDPVEIRTRT